MKKTILLTLTIFTLCISINISSYGQGIGSVMLPDPFPAPPSNSNFYYQNKGQIIDELGNLHPEIKYYTEHTGPSIFLAEDKVSFVAVQYGDTSIVGVMDTMYRIDLQFICDDIAGDDGSSGDNPGDGGGDEGGGEEQPEDRCGDIMVYEQSQDHLNYFLPHCGAGITDVKGYARVVYHNAFPNIDVHFYSNAQAPILYFVVKPGGNPNDITLLFSGQDSIQAMGGALSMYLSEWTLDFPQAIAYEVDNTNNINMLGWLPIWDHQGGGTVKVNTGPYNLGDDLVIRVGGDPLTSTSNNNLWWSTYYGGVRYEQDARLVVDDNNFYHALCQEGGNFSSLVGVTTSFSGGYDMYISKFTHTGTRNWATYYGGSSYDYAAAMVIGHYGVGYPAPKKGLWVGGYTYSLNASMFKGTGSFQQFQNLGTYPVHSSNGILVFFDIITGEPEYSTFFGAGEGVDDWIDALGYDNESHSLYIAGHTGKKNRSNLFANSPSAQTNGSFPLYSGSGTKFFQGNKSVADDLEGFIAKFKTNNMSLEWSTLFGGVGYEKIKSLKIKKEMSGHSVYIGGSSGCKTVTGSYPSPITSVPLNAFPLANPGNGAFFQSSTFNETNTSHNFVAKFNANLQLEWSTFLGRSQGGIKNIQFNSQSEMYVVSDGMEINYASSSSNIPNGSGRVPVYNNSISYYEAPTNIEQRTYIAKFNNNLSLNWATYLMGGFGNSWSEGIRLNNIGLGVDTDDRVFLGISQVENIPIPTYNPHGAYLRNQNASFGTSIPYAQDGYIWGFNKAGQVLWGTFFGGTSTGTGSGDFSAWDKIDDLGVYDNKYLFLTGTTGANITAPYVVCPGSFAYCNATHNGIIDVHISRFNTSLFPALNVNTINNSLTGLNVYPNPSNGLFNISFINTETILKCNIRIADIMGRELSDFVIDITQGNNRFNIDLENFAPGIYLLEIAVGNKKSNAKLVKY